MTASFTPVSALGAWAYVKPAAARNRVRPRGRVAFIMGWLVVKGKVRPAYSGGSTVGFDRPFLTVGLGGENDFALVDSDDGIIFAVEREGSADALAEPRLRF